MDMTYKRSLLVSTGIHLGLLSLLLLNPQSTQPVLEADMHSKLPEQMSHSAPAPIQAVAVDAKEIETALAGLDVRVVRNPHPQEGQASSLRLGLAAWSGKESISMDAYCIGLADQPLVGAHEITSLMDAHHHRPAGCAFTQPFVEGLPGNPVMFSDTVRQDLLAASGESGGRQWQQAHPTQVHRWGTPNAHYRIDLDSPEDIRAFTLRTGRELLWPPAVKLV